MPLWRVLAHLRLRKLDGRAVLEPQLAQEKASPINTKFSG